MTELNLDNNKIVYAGAFRRVVSFFLDGLIFSVFTMLLLGVGFVGYLFLDAKGWVSPHTSSTMHLSWVNLVSLLYIYFICLYLKYGASLGQMIMKIKVFQSNMQAVTIKHVLLYVIVDVLFLYVFMLDKSDMSKATAIIFLILSFIGVGWTLANIISFFVTDKQQTLNNKISGTIVVYQGSNK